MSLLHNLTVPFLCIKLTNHISLFTKSLKGNIAHIRSRVTWQCYINGQEQTGSADWHWGLSSNKQSGTRGSFTMVKAVKPWSWL